MGFDRKEIDDKILDELHDGRNVPSNMAETLDVSRQYVSQRLKLLEAADHVTNVGRGVYELVDDPREDDSEDPLERVADALNEIEAAFDRDDPDAARAALDRAQEAISDGDPDV